jgi:putative transposase
MSDRTRGADSRRPTPVSGSPGRLPPNALDRQFDAARPNQNWVADVTHSWTAEGWLYVAAVIDLHPCRLAGWSTKPEWRAVSGAVLLAPSRGGGVDPGLGRIVRIGTDAEVPSHGGDPGTSVGGAR